MPTSTNRPVKTILISGASIAGPSLAYWLSKYGYKVTIVEQAPALREGGYAVDMRGVTRTVAERMGIMKRVRQNLTGLEGMSYVDAQGQPLASMESDKTSGESFISEIEIMRGDLAHILYDLTKDRATYIWNDSIASIAQVDTGVQVTFEHAQPQTFDLVIGADGLHSHTRALVFGPEAQFVKPLGYYASIFTIPNYLKLQHRQVVYNVPGKIGAMYPARDNAEAKAMLYFMSEPFAYDHRDQAQQKQILAERYAGEGWEIPRLLKELDSATDLYFDAVSQVHMPTWSQGRVALIGDAAFSPSPMSGQGTGVAMVAAYVLAGELKAANGNYVTAFANYEKELRSYTDTNQKAAVGNARQFIPPTNFEIKMRNLNIRLLPHMPWKNIIAKAIQAPSNAITLKDY